MRFERKYRIENMSIGHVIQIVKSHPSGFYKAFPDRVVNNIYFDTPNLECFNDNLNGLSHRKKYRVRWYAEKIQHISNPKLEIKYKENMLGGKVVFDIKEFSLHKLSDLKATVNNQIAEQFTLQPVLLTGDPIGKPDAEGLG